MIEDRGARSSEEDRSDGVLWDLLRDLAELSRAHARLTEDLVRLLERMEARGRAAVPPPAVADSNPAQTEPDADLMPPAKVDTPPEAEASLAAPHAAEVEMDTPPTADAEAEAESRTELQPEPEPEPEPEPGPEQVEPDAIPAPAIEGAEVEIVDGAESGSEAGDEGDGSGPVDATVLTLESGDTRVGVNWDQVIRVGTLDAPNPPDEIEMEGTRVPLVSLGRLLHGVSREEKCFVVIESEGERASVACERALGIGPLGSLAKHDPNARIQVLRVPMLRAFAHAPSNGNERPEEKPAPPTPAEIEAEERDRHGPLRALVAVRYLPARVAICRHLRGKGWQVGEAAGLEAATVSLDLGRWDLFFLEASGNGEPSETESTLLRRVDERGVPVVRVGSRISGYPGQDAPSLMFPFSEAELEEIILRLSRRDVSA